ncbi:MAG: carboxypeptidase regulatory-like domain-containing protein, partial [bacterium]
SDGNGVVTFDNVPVGNDYTVRVISRARARTGTSGVLTVSQGALTSVDIGLSVLGVVSGSLVDTESTPERPIAGGHITLSSGSITTRTTTDGSGNFRFDGVPEGHFTISGFDFESGRSTTTSPDFILTSTIQELDGIKLTLEPTASLSVQVFLPNDAGGPGAPAPLVDVIVAQDSGYHREQQRPGSGIVLPKPFAKGGSASSPGELGGEERSVSEWHA